MKRIYILCDPREADPIKRIRYVGISQDPQTRLVGHMAIRSSRTMSDKHRAWVGELVSLGLLPILEILDETDISEADIIRKYRSAGADLNNIGRGTRARIDGKESIRAEHVTPVAVDDVATAKQFSARLIEKRRERKLSQEELALLAGVKRQQIGKLEMGMRNPQIHTVLAVAKALKCKAGWLGFGDEK